MNDLFRYAAKMNLLYWIAGVVVFHGLLYYFFRTDNWVMITLTASAVWAAGLLILKAIGRAYVKEEAE